MSRKRIVVSGALPARNSPAERIAHADEDVRDLTAKMRQSIREKASEYTVTGWTLDEESYEAAKNGLTIVLSAVMTRE